MPATVSCIRLFVCVLVVVVMCVAPVSGQASRHVVTIPPGFELVEVGGHKVICEMKDRQWVEQALHSVTPAERPATMPTNLLDRIADARADLVTEIATDFALDETSGLQAQIDRMVLELQSLESLRVPIFHLCTTEARLKELLSTEAWSDPSVRYNLVADQLMFRPGISLVDDRPMDDAVVITLYGADEEPAAKARNLAERVAAMDGELQKMISGRSMFITQMMLIEAIMQEAIAPLELPVDQQWLGVGLAGAMSAEYASVLVGRPRRELLILIAAELSNSAVHPRSIDLMNPPDMQAIRPEFIPAYADAYRRRSVAVAIRIVEENREKLPRLMRSLQEHRLESGKALIARIAEITGVDVSGDMPAR